MKTIFGNLLNGGSVLIPSAVHLPKVDTPNQVIEFAELFEQVNFQEKLLVRFQMFNGTSQFLWFSGYCNPIKDLSKLEYGSSASKEG